MASSCSSDLGGPTIRIMSRVQMSLAPMKPGPGFSGSFPKGPIRRYCTWGTTVYLFSTAWNAFQSLTLVEAWIAFLSCPCAIFLNKVCCFDLGSDLFNYCPCPKEQYAAGLEGEIQGRTCTNPAACSNNFARVCTHGPLPETCVACPQEFRTCKEQRQKKVTFLCIPYD